MTFTIESFRAYKVAVHQRMLRQARRHRSVGQHGRAFYYLEQAAIVRRSITL